MVTSSSGRSVVVAIPLGAASWWSPQRSHGVSVFVFAARATFDQVAICPGP